jgi:hypothetical protein
MLRFNPVLKFCGLAILIGPFVFRFFTYKESVGLPQPEPFAWIHLSGALLLGASFLLDDSHADKDWRYIVLAFLFFTWASGIETAQGILVVPAVFWAVVLAVVFTVRWWLVRLGNRRKPRQSDQPFGAEPFDGL